VREPRPLVTLERVARHFFIATQIVGERGHVTGIDMTLEMLAKARSAAAKMGPLTSSSSTQRQSPSLSRTRALTS
jgi:hypothetical protein